MTTDRKTEANRRNAQKSTGPRTPRGKSVASRNAISHGLLAGIERLPAAEQQAFGTVHGALVADLQPVGASEDLLVEQIAANACRLRQIILVESGLFGRYSEMTRVADRAGRPAGESGAVQTRDGRSQPIMLADAFLRDAGGPTAFDKLTRYRTSSERALDKALARLLQLQDMRLEAGGTAMADDSEAGIDAAPAVTNVGTNVSLADGDAQDRGDGEDDDHDDRDGDADGLAAAEDAESRETRTDQGDVEQQQDPTMPTVRPGAVDVLLFGDKDAVLSKPV